MLYLFTPIVAKLKTLIWYNRKMDVQIEKAWEKALQKEFEKDYFTQLSAEVRADYLLGDPAVFPPAPLVFNAFNLTPFYEVKVAILGQDPYHGPQQAHGLAFSVPDEVRVPPSLKNIYKELHGDTGTPIPESGNLEHWARQGVLLLNTTLTVEASNAGSHQGRGWETFTDAVIQIISDQKEHIVFILWGNFARSKAKLIDEDKHLIIESPHPSPLSAHNGFFGSKPFSKTNQYLKEHNQSEINW